MSGNIKYVMTNIYEKLHFGDCRGYHTARLFV